jgi:hypothetical protein
MTTNLDASAKLKEIKELTDHVYDLQQKAKLAETEFKAAKAKLCEIMENAEVEKMQGETCTASCGLKSSVSVPKDHADKKRLFDYITNNHSKEVLFDMLTINARTFSSWYTAEEKIAIENGNFEFSIDGIKPHEYYSVGLRKRAVKK